MSTKAAHALTLVIGALAAAAALIAYDTYYPLVPDGARVDKDTHQNNPAAAAMAADIANGKHLHRKH